jgi:hypothetical protein
VRSLAVLGAGDDFVEVGWYEKWTWDYPRVFAAWNGDSGYDDNIGNDIDENVNKQLKIVNPNGSNVWYPYYAGNLFAPTGVVPFHKGRPITNTESDVVSDEPFSHFNNLNWCETVGCTEGDWNDFDPFCFLDDNTEAHYEYWNHVEHFVKSGSYGAC